MSGLADEYELSQYTEIEALDKMGKVYIVKDIRDKGIWVKKEIDEHSLYAYNRLCGIVHNNIACVRKVLSKDGRYFVIQEYINGTDVKQLVSHNGPMDIDTVRKIMCCVCDGIILLHQKDIIHRDVTPSNVMLSVDGSVKLVDLGISRIKKGNKGKDTTIMGTVGYASPEQFGFDQTDAASDIYSCGALMNFMLTGALPDECRYKGKMDYVINCCMMMEPKARYQSAEELKTAITNCCIHKKDLLKLPGFRSNTPWKSITASCIYCLIIFWFLSALLCFTTNFSSVIFGLYIGVFCYVIPFLLATDYAYYLERLPFTRKKKKRTRTVLGIVFAIVFMYALYAVYYYLIK